MVVTVDTRPVPAHVQTREDSRMWEGQGWVGTEYHSELPGEGQSASFEDISLPGCTIPRAGPLLKSNGKIHTGLDREERD